MLSFLYSPILTSIHDYWKNHSLTRQTLVGKVMSLLLNMLSRLVITFLPRRRKVNFFGGGVVPKSLQMVTAAMKLKDAYSLEEKL